MFRLVLLIIFSIVFGQSAVVFPNTRIVGGKDADIKDYPYQISLLHRGNHICGGSIISPRRIITAAHCTDGSNVKYLSIRAGSSLVNSGGETISVEEVHQHPQYSSATIDNDISILVLSSSIEIDNAMSIDVANANTTWQEGANATVTGWGSLYEGGSASLQLQMVNIPMISSEQCKSYYGSSSITSRMICAGYSAGGKDSCQGDSGGPLVINNTLIGIVSWGYGCARPNAPGVYTNIKEFNKFIKSVNGGQQVSLSIITCFIMLGSFLMF